MRTAGSLDCGGSGAPRRFGRFVRSRKALPPLRSRLLEAVARYPLTALAEAGPDERRAADYLRELLRRFDLAQVRQTLEGAS